MQMAQFEIFEGSWEEIIEKNFQELAGKRVRVIVLPERESQSLDRALGRLLAEADALDVQRPEPPYKKADPFWDELVEKYGNQGFKL